MKLLLDLGNSRCKYALLHEGDKIEYGAQDYGPFGKLYTVKSLCDKDNIKKVIICSVLSEKMNSEIIDVLVNKDGHDVYSLSAEKNSFGVQLAYENPITMGADRVSALIAAKNKYPGNVCVVDCGTAITIDALDGDGVHKGGVIFPSAKVMQKDLLNSTNIESDNDDVKFNIFADTTGQAIYAGCMSATGGGIEFTVNKMIEQNEKFDQIIFTGGGAEQMEHFVNLQVEIDSTLVLDGLRVVAKNI